MKTLVASPFQDDAEELLEWAFGSPAKYRMQLFMQGDAQRPGQAFMNTLWIYDREGYHRIQNSEVNPFYLDRMLGQALELWTSK